MLRTEVTVGGCCWAVETTIRRSLFYEVNAKILCFCGQRSHPQVFTGRSPGAPSFAHFAKGGIPHPLTSWDFEFGGWPTRPSRLRLPHSSRGFDERAPRTPICGITVILMPGAPSFAHFAKVGFHQCQTLGS